MTENTVIWQIIREHVPRKTWLSIGTVYDIVEHHAAFDREDLKPGRDPANLPRWKSNVRRILKDKKKDGRVLARRT